MPSHIFHLAAITDLRLASEINIVPFVNMSRNAISAAEAYNAELIYISTAGSVDGLKSSYPDWFNGNPLSVYGEQKWPARYVYLIAMFLIIFIEQDG